jgi:sterol desaturase/sphingolipid hydroxylase (fatty acid hydroxylase superfamily)
MAKSDRAFRRRQQQARTRAGSRPSTRPAAKGRLYKVCLAVLTIVGWVIVAAFVGGVAAGLLLLPFSELFDWVPPSWVAGVIWAVVAVPAAFIFLRSTALVDQRSAARRAT